MEIDIVSQNKDLFNKVTFNLLIQIIRVIQTDFNHFAHQCTYDEKCTAIHAGNWIINHYNLILHFFVTEATSYKVVEI